ncbi:MAG: sugar ABC transporter permease [Lentisphaeria bacterium]|nr:sugar ABC transporter permease [Lentisphaeria bacterium]
MKWGFVGPTLVFLIAFNIFPLFYSIFLSFTDAQMGSEDKKKNIGGENYGKVLNLVEDEYYQDNLDEYNDYQTKLKKAEISILNLEPNSDEYSDLKTQIADYKKIEKPPLYEENEYLNSLRVTTLFVFLAVSIELILGFFGAMALRDRYKFPLKPMIIIALLVPMLLSPAVMGLFWSNMLSQDTGVINLIISKITGTSTTDLAQNNMAWNAHWKFASILLVDVWMWTPFMMLICMAGLNSIPNYIYEAAEIDRASPWTIFRRITLPMSAPLIMLAVLLRITDAVKQFDLVMTLSNANESSTATVSTMIYKKIMKQFQVGEGSAYAIVVLVIIIAIATVFTRYIDKIQNRD